MGRIKRGYELAVSCWEIEAEGFRGGSHVVRRYGLDLRVEAGGAEPCVYVVDGERVFEVRATELVRAVRVAVREEEKKGGE